MLNCTGRIIKRMTLESGNLTVKLPIEELSAAVYQYRIINNKAIIGNGKIIVE